MLYDSNSVIRAVSADVLPTDIEAAKIYIKGAVHCFCKNNPSEKFSARTLFGGENRDWNDTPLQKIYDYYAGNNANDAVNRAAVDVGWLLKTVLAEDKKWTYNEINGYIKEYRKI